MTDDENLLIVPVPSLIATLLNKERAKGSPLSETEVLEIRDQCPSIAMTKDQYEKICESRGYLDIDPENAWDEWAVQRTRFIKE
jgi:hypothetical protein